MDSMKSISPQFLLDKWKGSTAFMDFIYRFAITVSWTDHQRVDLVKAHQDNIFLVDLANNIAWVVVKMIDNQYGWGIRTGDAVLEGVEEGAINVAHVSKRGRKSSTRFTKKGRMSVGVDGWNEEGKSLYKILRGCLKAIDPSHWEEDWQGYWEKHPDNTWASSKRKSREWENVDEANAATGQPTRVDAEDMKFAAV